MQHVGKNKEVRTKVKYQVLSDVASMPGMSAAHGRAPILVTDISEIQPLTNLSCWQSKLGHKLPDKLVLKSAISGIPS